MVESAERIEGGNERHQLISSLCPVLCSQVQLESSNRDGELSTKNCEQINCSLYGSGINRAIFSRSFSEVCTSFWKEVNHSL
jgi:hypothetical protein